MCTRMLDGVLDCLFILFCSLMLSFDACMYVLYVSYAVDGNVMATSWCVGSIKVITH